MPLASVGEETETGAQNDDGQEGEPRVDKIEMWFEIVFEKHAVEK